ncbi:MAG: hypothetical protein M1401_02400 [Chloroflexi bacterium]|nr:hypothetical protein [Chloroflexota bacterium]MCL5107725.1 hypothetical protein [Chloroflexota bacterium]
MFDWLKLLATVLVVVWLLGFGFAVTQGVMAGMGLSDSVQRERDILADRASWCGLVLEDARNNMWGARTGRTSYGAQKGAEACLRLLVP